MKQEPEIDFWRGKIDKINHQLLELLNTRVTAARKIGFIKKKKGLPISDPKREKAILDNLVKDNKGPMDNRGIFKIFKAIIAETKRIERGV